MMDNTRKHLYSIAQYNAQDKTISDSTLHTAFDKLVYQTNSQQWLSFAKVLSLAMGLGSLVIGMIFFFAYNWAGLDKFVKFALVQGVFVTFAIVTLIAHYQYNKHNNQQDTKNKLQLTLRNICLTVTAIAVGAIFALIGQIYQSTADSYTLFTLWAVCIFPFACIARFAPLWLLWTILINLSLGLYPEITDFKILSLLLLNSLFFIVINRWQERFFYSKSRHWFMPIMVVICVIYATIGSSIAVLDLFDKYTDYNTIVSIPTLFVTGLGYYLLNKYAFYNKKLYILACIYFSLIIIGVCFWYSLIRDIEVIFVCAVFIIGSLVFLVNYLQNLKNTWSAEQVPKQLAKDSEEPLAQTTIEDQPTDNSFQTTLNKVLHLDKQRLTDKQSQQFIQQYDQQQQKSSLIVTAVSFFGGVFASQFVLAFFALVLLDGSVNFYTYIILGVILLGIIIALEKADSLVLDGMNASFYFSAIALIYLGLTDYSSPLTDYNIDKVTLTCAMIATMAGMLLITMRSYVMRLASFMTFFVSFIVFIMGIFNNHQLFINNVPLAVICLLLLVASVLVFSFEPAIVSYLVTLDNKNKQANSSLYTLQNHFFAFWQPLKLAVLVTMIGSVLWLSEYSEIKSLTLDQLLSWQLFTDLMSLNNILAIVMVSLGSIALLLYLLLRFNNNRQILVKQQMAVICLALLIALISAISYPFIIVSLLVLLLAFYSNDKLWQTLATIALLCAVGRYYYNLNTTLLVKSIAMMVSGVFFMAVYGLLSVKNKQEVAL